MNKVFIETCSKNHSYHISSSSLLFVLPPSHRRESILVNQRFQRPGRRHRRRLLRHRPVTGLFLSDARQLRALGHGLRQTLVVVSVAVVAAAVRETSGTDARASFVSDADRLLAGCTHLPSSASPASSPCERATTDTPVAIRARSFSIVLWTREKSPTTH